MRTKTTTMLLLFCIIWKAGATIKLPDLISDHMVLQQQTKVRLWGEAFPEATITVNTSWLTKTPIEITADSDGQWELFLQTPEASFTPHSIIISDGTPITINDVLIGEVWLCSGQSNMEMPLNGFWNCPIQNSNNLIADAGNHAGIRMATIERKGALTPQAYAKGIWKVSNPENAPGFSATAYHYALSLQRTLQVPVGIIACAWGGSRVEGWLPKEILETYPDEDLSKIGNKEGLEYLQPMIMYNGLLKPSSRYTIKGFTWYQGCSNVGKADVYAERLATMVRHWRTLWENENLPFYYAEIAPFSYDDDSNGINGALLREAQFKAQSLIPNSGMISTNDLVEPYETPQIHPWNKKDVGERLAYQALNKTYGYSAIFADSPSFRSMEIRENKAEIFFDNAPEGFSPWVGIEGFEIAGSDKVFHPANATINHNKCTLIVSAESVQKPVAVRYCFKNFQIGNVKNHRNLPIIPFRTDNW